MSPRLLALLALPAIAFAAVPASAQKPHYTLTATEHTDKKTGNSASTQTLRNRYTGRIVWVRHFPSAENITWAKDHKAVVFEVSKSKSDLPSHQSEIKLATWQVGGGVEAFFMRPPVRNVDYTEDFYWSPDKKHLLLRVGGSGSADMNIGMLYCLNVKTHRAILISETTRRVHWISTRQAGYQSLSYTGGGPDPKNHNTIQPPVESSKSRLWRLPKGF